MPEGTARSEVFSVRITTAEREDIDKAAGLTGESAGDWARRVLAEAARSSH